MITMVRKYKLILVLTLSLFGIILFLLLYALTQTASPITQTVLVICIAILVAVSLLLTRTCSEMIMSFKKIINTSVNCIFIKNRRGQYELVNQAILELYLMEHDSEIIGKTDYELAEQNKTTYEEATQRVLEDDLVRSTQQPKLFPVNEFVKQDGSTNLYQVKKTPFNSLLSKGAVLGVSIDITRRKEIEKELSEVRRNERKKIIADIHDITGYAFTNINMVIEAAITYIDDPKELKRLLYLAKKHVQQSLLEARIALHTLGSVEENKGITGINALESLAAIFTRSTGVNVIIQAENVEKAILNRIINQDVYRIFQEAITNAFNHGGANTVVINFLQSGNDIQVVITDDGSGCEEPVYGIGLHGIEERAKLMRGTMKIPALQNGFQLIINIPILTEARNEW